MTRRAALGVAAVIVAATVLLTAQATPPPRAPQTFRTSTDVVAVDVSVRSGGRAVTDLRAGDFVLTDNGVRQQIDSIETTAVPIDVTLVVDVSGDHRRPWQDRVDPTTVAAALDAEVKKVTAILRPTDRIRLLAIDRYVQQVWPLQPSSAVAPVSGVESDGLAAVYDTLAAALLQPVEPERRHVVVARTKGVDTISSIDAIALRAIAERSDALFHLVLMETALDNDDETSAFQCLPMPGGTGNSAMGLCWPTNRSWVPRRGSMIGPRPFHIVTAEGGLVKTGVEATGGRWHQTTGLSEPTLTGTFRETFENFRTNYVLRYSPRGVTRQGWHAISVTVPGHRNYDINARKGYGIDELPPPSPPPAPVATPRTLAELTTAYGRGAYQAVVTSLGQMPDTTRLLREFEASGNPWPATPRREAAFMLELAEPSVFSPRAAEREQAHRLLLRFSNLILDPLEPSVFERYWYFAALAHLQGALQPATASAFVERALARFPTEPQFVLARAIVEDQRSYARRAQGQPTRSAADEARVRQYYEAAIAVPEVAVEAHLRLAWYFHRTGQSTEAAVLLQEASAMTTTDPVLRYWRELFTGLVLQSQGSTERAITAFRAALVIVPTAQSARVALMNTLALRGDRAEAEALAEQVQGEPLANVVDPWWMYWQGQYRFQPQIMARVRELAR